MTNIVLNHRRAAELAIDHLAGLGHRQIALIKGQAFSSDTEPRWQAIQHAAAKANLKLNPELVAQLEGDSPSHDPGYFAAQRLLDPKTHLQRSSRSTMFRRSARFVPFARPDCGFRRTYPLWASTMSSPPHFRIPD